MRPGSVSPTPIMIIVVGILGFGLLTWAFWPRAEQFENQNLNSVVRNTNVAVPDANSNANTNTSVSNANLGVVTNQNSNADTNTAGDATDNWELYTNTDLGFSIKLPPGWSVDTSRTSVEEIVVTDTVTAGAREAIKSTVTEQSIDEWTLTFQGEPDYRVSDYTLDGYAGKRVRFAGLGGDYIGVKIDSALYMVTVGRMEENGMLGTVDLQP